MPVARPLGSKLFLEGVEVPYIGATMTCAVGQASVVYADMVPQKEINAIKPRTHVALGVRDYNNKGKNYPYVYAWEGEVFGYSFSKTPGTRAFTLQCIDLSSHWDNVMAYFLNPTTSLGKGGAEITGVGLDLDTAQKSGVQVIATTNSSTSYLYQVLRSKSAEGDYLTGFTEVYKTIGNINDFFRIADKRLRISDRIVLRSSGKLTELLKQSEAFSWFEGIVGRTSGGFATLRSVIQDLMSIVFHDFTPIPFPAAVEKDGLEGVSASDKSDGKKTTIGQFVFKPNLYMISPPMCNVFFPDEYSSFSYSRNFFQEPTRLVFKPQLPLLLGAGRVVLPYRFEPPAYQNFMLGKESWDKFKGDDDEAVKIPPKGNFGGNDPDPKSAETNNGVIREGQFLTNEERVKGIWMAIETLMPAASTFQESFGDEGKKSLLSRIAKYLFYKKRFENRSLQITSHLKLSVVPGFPVLLLDGSEAEQSTLAYCTSVTHRIYATEGGYTNVHLSYARTVLEESNASSKGTEPSIPPWYDEKIFGEKKKPEKSEAAGTDLSDKLEVVVGSAGKNLSQFYKAVLGNSGTDALIDRDPAEPTIIGGTKSLLAEYQSLDGNNSELRQDFIAAVTGRDYIELDKSFAFIGAKQPQPEDEDVDENQKPPSLHDSSFNVFTGGAFDVNNDEYKDILTKKLSIIKAYRDMLQKHRGFRG